MCAFYEKSAAGWSVFQLPGDYFLAVSDAVRAKLDKDRCPQGMGYEWTAMSYQEEQVGN